MKFDKFLACLILLFILGILAGITMDRGYLLIQQRNQIRDTIDYQHEINDAVMGGRIPDSTQ
jgi:hypothetical protein